jgi:membrane fusion protein, multidrug efflux system
MTRSAGPARWRIVLPGLAVLAVVAGGWLLAGRTGGIDAPAAAGAEAPVPTLELAATDVVTAERRVLARRLPISGSLTPLVQSQIKSRVAGEVLEVMHREGEAVRRGEVLLRIDTRSQEAQVASQQAALDKARADLGIATLNFHNSERLLAKKFIAQNVLDTARSVRDAAAASVKLAEAQLRLAEIALADAVVRAPFDAVVARRFAEPGEKVSSDSALLELVDLSRLELQAAAPAAETPAIAPGQLAEVRVDGFGERVFQARVERINPVTEQGSRQILLYLSIDNADRALRGGMFAQGELVIERSAPVLAVPAAAVSSEAGIDYAWAIENGVLVRKQLTLGPARGANNLVEVREGLNAGATLLAVAIEALESGQPVIVTGASGVPGPGGLAVAPGAGD